MKSNQNEKKLIEEKLNNINKQVAFILEDYKEREDRLIKEIDILRQNFKSTEDDLKKRIEDINNDLDEYKKELLVVAKVIASLKFLTKTVLVVAGFLGFLYEFFIKPYFIDTL